MPNLQVDDSFKVGLFNSHFDYVLSVSVFTHLYMNHIIMCLEEVKQSMTSEGVFFESFYEAPRSAHVVHITHMPSRKVTRYNQNPFHYSFDEITMMAAIARMKARYIGNWNHPRGQIMVSFSKQRELINQDDH